MKKNDIIDIEITDTTLDGNGVGKYEGMAVFVRSAVAGDIVKAHILKVKSNCAFAKIYEIVKPSDKRTEPLCESYSKCGGCVFRHLLYPCELAVKENAVRNSLKRIGGVEPDFEPIAYGSPEFYRNKCQYPVSKTESGVSVGFYSSHSHRVTDCPECSLQPKEFSEAAGLLKKYINDYSVSVYDGESGIGLIRHLYVRKAVATGELMICLVINGDSIPQKNEILNLFLNKFGSALKTVVLNINTEKTNVILGKRCVNIYGNGYITDILCGVKVRISPLSFYQVNHGVAEKLYRKAAEYAEPENKTVIDLYCGAGTIGLSMAHMARQLIGVEIIPQAVEDAKFNAAANGFDNCRFICGDAFKAAEQLKSEGIKPDVVIVDPPRKGCSPELIETVANGFSPERVVYVSCDPATLARDLKLFREHGYLTLKAAPFDMFPKTGHVETVCSLAKVKE